MEDLEIMRFPNNSISGLRVTMPTQNVGRLHVVKSHNVACREVRVKQAKVGIDNVMRDTFIQYRTSAKTATMSIKITTMIVENCFKSHYLQFIHEGLTRSASNCSSRE